MLKRSHVAVPIAALALLYVATVPASAAGARMPRLGTALNFTAVAGSTVTNTGPSVITGNLGLDPGSAVTGFPPGRVTGVKDIANAVALNAKRDLVTAYTDAATAPATSDLTGKNLGGKQLTPGVYKFDSSAQLTGTLTLSGKGIYIFQIGSTLTTASNAVVRLVNNAQACGVFWQVGSSATLGSATHFQGNLMALTSVTMVTGANILTGRALARNGALTLDRNDITRPTGTCTVSSTSGSGGQGGGSGSPSTPNTGVGNGQLPIGEVVLLVGVSLTLVGRRLSTRRP